MQSKSQKLFIGCVADDFTGASDAASFLSKSGLRTVLTDGLPRDELCLDDQDAIVIGLKSRCAPKDKAVEQSLAALRRLQTYGVKQFYIKYCSTFDSTPIGNIGPVIDAAMEFLDVSYTVLCPSLPVNGRVVKAGKLYVNGVPLAESHMRNHPLNPMWSSDISTLMETQSAYPCFVLNSSDEWSEQIAAFQEDNAHFYLIPDYENDAQGNRIAEYFGNMRLLTGGSGLLEHLALRNGIGYNKNNIDPGTVGRGLILCGSCSKVTLNQICTFKKTGGSSFALNPMDILSGKLNPEDIWDFILNKNESVLVYSIGAESQTSQGDSTIVAAACLEKTMAYLGHQAVSAGFTRLIVAGGETSGAVMRALNWNAYHIGSDVAPGVPVLTPVNRPEIRIVLKSGNFGQADFFTRALAMTSKI